MIIEEFDFYESLSPQLKTKLMVVLFRPFEIKFYLFFSELERLFINEVIVNLYARIFQPGDTVIEPCS